MTFLLLNAMIKKTKAFVLKGERYNMNDIGKQFRAAREQLGLRQSDVCKMTNLSTSYYSDIERGKKIPRVETMQILAKVLKIHPNIYEDTKKDTMVQNADFLSVMEGLDEEDSELVYKLVKVIAGELKKRDNKNR